MSIICVRKQCCWEHKFNEKPKDFLRLIRSLVSKVKADQKLQSYQLYDINIKREGSKLNLVFYFMLNNQKQTA
ncbi:hypothetical protein IMX26_02435 [Clostridium sp. 'deep sea']|uniref:hypothetical protein n=1 Tax=Clostridium sp. 'deep sea' TaxID=2779445 RepID=UPI0018964EC4|nr:hypothetical protein [Clostridium sp. 'deep sea']QOR35710.1 hypothetical protein IMX26_02435 [Clostridium sp. 'deep sea']